MSDLESSFVPVDAVHTMARMSPLVWSGGSHQRTHDLSNRSIRCDAIVPVELVRL